MTVNVTEFLQSRGAYVDEDNRIHIHCLCDGTLYFLYEMGKFLKAIGCTDIKADGRIATEGIPEDKPWCNCLYEASGVLPDGTVYVNGVLGVKTELYDERKALAEGTLSDLLNSIAYQNNAVPATYIERAHGEKLFILSETEGQYIDTGYRPKIE